MLKNHKVQDSPQNFPCDAIGDEIDFSRFCAAFLKMMQMNESSQEPEVLSSEFIAERDYLIADVVEVLPPSPSLQPD